MANTIRERIILAALIQLALIQISGGYHYDMETPLRAVKDVPPGLLPVSDLYPQPEESVAQYGKDNPTFTLRVESLQNVALGDNASVIQEKMLGDLRKNLTNPAEKWYSGLADSVKYAEGGPTDQPEAEAETTAIYVLLTIDYKTALGDPYST